MDNFTHVHPANYFMADIPKLVGQNGSSYYSVNGVRVPRITHVLSSYNAGGLQQWRKRVGNDVADLKCKIGIKRGNEVHQIIQSYLGNDCICKYSDKLLAIGMFEAAKPVLGRISMIRGTELPLYSKRFGIAGTADCIAEFDGVLSIIDYKTGEIPKKIEWCERYFLQETFYSLTWEEMTESPIEQLVTIVISETGEVQVIKEQRDDWVQILEELVNKFHQQKQMGVRK